MANKAQGHSLAPSCNYSKFPEISGNYQAAQTVANNVDSSKYPTTYTSYVYANCENKPCNFLKFQEVLAFPSYYLSSSFFLSAAQKEILKSSSSSSRVGVQGEGEIPKRDDDDDDNLTFSKQPRRQTPKQRQSPDAVPEAAFLEAWNACPHFSPARNLQGDRLTQFRARCREPDWLEHWREALVRAQQSTFCCGQRQGWHATIDWFLRPDTVTRLLEGFYDDRRKQTPMEEFTEALKRKLEEQKNR